MSTTQVSIRLGVEGKAEVKRAFEEVGQVGTQAFGQVDRALEKTGAATDRETARFKRLAEAARMAAQADAAQGRFNQILGVDRQTAGSARASAEVFEQAEKEAERYEARARALRATLDPLAAAQDRLNAELAEHAALASRGAITTAEQAAANALAKSRFDQTAQAIKGVGANSKLTTQQVMTLQYTVNDVIASLSTGMSPMTILMQQGGQVTQAFGGLRGTIMTLGSAIGVVGGVIAGVAVAVGVLTAAWFANDASTRAVATALAGVGRASGATAAQLEQVAQSSAEAGKVSVSSARDMQVAFLRTGKIGAEEMGRAIAVSRNLGVTLGVDTKQAADELARALADPLRGADELNDRIRFLDDRTRAYVRTLVDQNNRAEAQRVILNALAPSLADAEQAVNALGRAWQFVGRSASNAFDALGKAVDRAVDGRTPTEELELLRWLQERLRANMRGNVVPLMLPQVERRIVELERQLNDQQERARRIAAEARANEQSVRAGEIARDTNPGAREIERLRTQEGVLRAALADPLVRSKLADVAEVEVDPSLASITRKYFEMRDESFIHMGERLAREIGGNFRIQGTKAIMSKRGGSYTYAVMAAWGRNLHSWDISPALGRAQYSKVRARWYDPKSAEWQETEEGTSLAVDARHDHRYAKPGEDEAAQQTASDKATSERDAGEGSVTIEGDTAAIPDGLCIVTGARSGVDGPWRIESVTHSYSRGGGFITQLSLKQPGSGGAGDT